MTEDFQNRRCLMSATTNNTWSCCDCTADSVCPSILVISLPHPSRFCDERQGSSTGFSMGGLSGNFKPGFAPKTQVKNCRETRTMGKDTPYDTHTCQYDRSSFHLFTVCMSLCVSTQTEKHNNFIFYLFFHLLTTRREKLKCVTFILV